MGRFMGEFRERCAAMCSVNRSCGAANIPVLPDSESVFGLSQGPPIVCERGLWVGWHHML